MNLQKPQFEKIKAEMPIYFPEPPADLVAEVATFYAGRILARGYDRRSPAAFDNLAEYFGRFYLGMEHEIKADSERYCRPKKGLLLYGPCGTGKTKALEIFNDIFWIPVVYVDVLIEQFAVRGETGFWSYVEQFNGRDISIDDIANEREVKSFGNASPIVDWIYRRERQFRDSGVLTNFSSNAKTQEEIEARYGSPAKSRICGMTEHILINAHDGRMEGK